MATSTETQIKPQQRQSTMPASTPSATNRRSGFFKRHLPSHRRRNSGSTSSPDSTHSPQPPRSPAPTSQPLSPASPTSVPQTILRGPSDDALSDTSTKVAEDSVLNLSTEAELTKVNSKGSRGIKWAANYDDPAMMPRARRASSSGANARRSSIYSRAAEGHFIEGVDAGVGSKARQLSIHIPDELEVFECPLEDHFSVFARISQKDIGEGGAAVVRLMKSKTAGSGSKDKVFAVKEFRQRDPEEEGVWEYERKIKSEYAIAKSLQHPNIVESFRLCQSDKRCWYHVMEYCDLGDLNDLIQKKYFSREDRNCMFKQLIRGVDYLHSRGIAHRDLKSENLLVNHFGCLKIADFGTGEVFSGTHPGLRNCRRASIVDPHDPIRYCTPGLVGSRPYMAPEILSRADEYDPRAVDVWAAAIVYLTLCFGGTPWDAASSDVKNYNIYAHTWDKYVERHPDGEIRADRPDLPGFAQTRQFAGLDDNGTRRLVFGMLHPDPQKRWTAAQALACQTVTEYACCQQDGYSDDIKTRQKKALHNHVPPKESKGPKFLKPTFDSK